MHWTEPATADDSHASLKKKLWDAANMLSTGAGLKPSDWSGATETARKGERGGAHQYSPTVLGLIFLLYADVSIADVLQKTYHILDCRTHAENLSELLAA